MDKKAVMMMTIVKAIVVIALVAILFYFFVNFVLVGNESNEREICRSSILLAAKSKILGKPLIESINCKTDYKTIKTDNPDEIKMEITNEMVDCWYQFGEHRKNFVEDWGKRDSWVFLCSRIDFKDGISGDTPEVKDFSEFWASKPLPFKNDISFYDYFYGGVPKDFNLVISTKEPVYVAFVGTKYNFLTDLAKEDPALFLYLSQSSYGVAGGDRTGVIPLIGILLADKIYNPDFHGTLYVGNSKNILELLNPDIDEHIDEQLVDEDECKPEETRPCLIDSAGVYGECLLGNELCSENGEWTGICEQILFPGNKKEVCDDSLDNDCDNMVDGEDAGDCPGDIQN